MALVLHLGGVGEWMRLIWAWSVHGQESGDLHRYHSVRVHPYAHPQHMKVLNHFIHTFNMDVRCSQGRLTASTKTLQCHLGPALPQVSKILPSPAQVYNSVSVHPYTHPQHMKVFIHAVYFQYGCGMQSVVVYSLNHDTRMSFVLCLTTIFQNSAPPAQV